MNGLCEYVVEADAGWAGGMLAWSDSAAYADYLADTIHEDQLIERADMWIGLNTKQEPLRSPGTTALSD